MTTEKEWTQEEIDNEYRQFWTNRNTTRQDLTSFYDILFMTNNPKHYETWLSKANRLYEEQSENLEGYENITLLLLIGKVQSLLEEVYES